MTAIIKTQELPKTAEKMPLKRQYVRFAFYRISPAFRKLDSNVKLQAKEEVLSTIDFYKEKMILLPYSMLATRSDADFMFWEIAEDLEIFDQFASKLLHTGLAPYLEMTHSFLSMTKHSMYVDKIDPEHQASRVRIHPGDHQYLFVYPFVKTREWYQLPKTERQKLMDEHIGTGNKYPSVKLNTTYSFGLDDQEFVVAFETDSPQDFLDLVQELREAKSSCYTQRDTPTFTCVSKDPKLILDSLA